MNGAAATYGFLPWMRRGVSTEITRVDGSGPEAPRATFPVTLVFNNATFDEQVTVDLALHGPGEVVGIDPRMIVRVDPSSGTTNAESNYFPLIEFDQPDFPWRYTPATATVGDRLRPWLVLIVLSDAEIVPPVSARAAKSLPTISVDVQHLPDLGQSWAWAHVQVAGVDPGFAADDQVARIIREAPARVVSRLLCARHLKPNTAYTAYLVPSFERGRLAGLNLDPEKAPDSMTPAWPSSDPNVMLPVYYQWSFQTGAEGDFESLVRQLLPPRTLTAAVGWRAMDGSHPGLDLPPVTPGEAPLALQGALMSAAALDSLPPRADNPAFVAAIEQLLNRPDQLASSLGGVRTVAPPLYGRWHAARPRLRATAALSWFDELNRDPRLRAVAGLGTRVVQDQQEQLLAAAWEQVEGIRAANKALREAELGAAVAGRLIERDWLALEPETTVQISAPILARILASPMTIRARLDRSPISAGVFEPQFRRLTRPLGPIGRRQSRAATTRVRFGRRAGPTGQILKRMNTGELSLPEPPTGSRLSTITRISERLPPPGASKRLAPPLLFILALMLLAWAAVSGLAVVAAAAAVLGILAARFWWISRRDTRRLGLLRHLASGTLTAAEIRRASAAPGFAPRGFVQGAPGGLSQTEVVANFQTALANLADRLRLRSPEPVTKSAVDFKHLQNRIMEAIKPERTITASTNRRLHLPTNQAALEGRGRDPGDSGPVMAAPVFEQPMYEPLRELSQEWLLPGVGQIPPETVTLVVSNQRFIEAYMLGLNHEMARELLWREYPTDQRGTYFRQFWDVRGYASPSGQKLHDIKPVTDWTAATALGTHRDSPPPPDGGYLVLLIRGQLLKRYPNTVIYAIKAVLDGTAPVAEGGRRTLSEEGPRYPLFRGSLEPDITFLGFDLGRAEVIGDDTTITPERQGWFFVLEEPPTGPRFGLEVKPADPEAPFAAWDGLSWRDLVSSEAELEAMSYVDLTSSLPHLPPPPAGEPQLAWHAAQGSRASDIASVTLQKPYRVAVHGSDMLPPPGA